MNNSEKTSALWYFESVNLYKALCPNKVKRMGDKHEYLRMRKDQLLHFPEPASSHIYLVVDGRVKIGQNLEDGKEKVSAILKKGELFGLLPNQTENKPSDFAHAISPAVVCPLTIDELQGLMIENKDLSFKILKLVGLRLMKMERKIELLVFKDVRTRIIEFLKDTAAWKGQPSGTETLIPLSLAHQDIASLTGTTRQTVTIILNSLKEANLIHFDRKKIIIRDLELLK